MSELLKCGFESAFDSDFRITKHLMICCDLLCSCSLSVFISACMFEMVCMAVASCACAYVKAARVATLTGGCVELKHWGMKWNGELRLGSDRGCCCC